MKNSDFNLMFFVNQTPVEVFNAINNVRGWWSEELEGNSEKLNDEFIYRYGDLHYSKHRLTEVIPYERIVWLTLESCLTFAANQQEWNETKMIFEISNQDGKTKLVVTHLGLVPELECFTDCFGAWTHYLQNSLVPLIKTGTGNPDQRKK